MSDSCTVRCRCGKVGGLLSDASRGTVNRVVCYCDDCQAFMHHLGRADGLDAHGGSDIVQVAPASLSFTEGREHIVGMRLSPKGLLRFHTSCCQTPIGNMVSPSIPFVGVSAGSVVDADARIGAPIGAILGRFAVGGAPPGSTGLNAPLLARAARKVLGWKLRGRAWPHPFFDKGATSPRYPVTVITKAEREALRRLCGPTPSA